MTDHGRDFAARLWAMRARAEIEAAARFERLARELTEANAHAEVRKMAAEAADDEVRHHRLCAGLARSFGAPSVVSSANPPPPVVLGTTTLRDRLLCELVAMSCITESLSAALLLEIKNEAQEDAVRQVAGEVVRDEIKHSRLGWAHLAFEAAERDLSFLAGRIPAMLGATVDAEIFGPDEVAAELARELAGLGGLSRRHRRDVLLATLEDVVFPGLRRFGVDEGPGRAWVRSNLSRG